MSTTYTPLERFRHCKCCGRPYERALVVWFVRKRAQRETELQQQLALRLETMCLSHYGYTPRAIHLAIGKAQPPVTEYARVDDKGVITGPPLDSKHNYAMNAVAVIAKGLIDLEAYHQSQQQ